MRPWLAIGLCQGKPSVRYFVTCKCYTYTLVSAAFLRGTYVISEDISKVMSSIECGTCSWAPGRTPRPSWWSTWATEGYQWSGSRISLIWIWYFCVSTCQNLITLNYANILTKCTEANVKNLNYIYIFTSRKFVCMKNYPYPLKGQVQLSTDFWKYKKQTIYDVRWKTGSRTLKGQCHEIFHLRFFLSNGASWAQ